MSRMGEGYGSEWHLAQYLRHRRGELGAAVARATGRRLLGWLEDPVDRRTGRPAKEWRGIDFLPADPALEAAWSAFWPAGRGVHSWDAVGMLEGDEWLLVEAKAHLEEIIAPCRARPEVGLPKSRKGITLWQRSSVELVGMSDL